MATDDNVGDSSADDEENGDMGAGVEAEGWGMSTPSDEVPQGKYILVLRTLIIILSVVLGIFAIGFLSIFQFSVAIVNFCAGWKNVRLLCIIAILLNICLLIYAIIVFAVFTSGGPCFIFRFIFGDNPSLDETCNILSLIAIVLTALSMFVQVCLLIFTTLYYFRNQKMHGWTKLRNRTAVADDDATNEEDAADTDGGSIELSACEEGHGQETGDAAGVEEVDRNRKDV